MLTWKTKLKLVEAIHTNYSDRYEEMPCLCGGNVPIPKSAAHVAQLEKAKVKELSLSWVKSTLLSFLYISTIQKCPSKKSIWVQYGAIALDPGLVGSGDTASPDMEVQLSLQFNGKGWDIKGDDES